MDIEQTCSGLYLILSRLSYYNSHSRTYRICGICHTISCLFCAIIAYYKVDCIFNICMTFVLNISYSLNRRTIRWTMLLVRAWLFVWDISYCLSKRIIRWIVLLICIWLFVLDSSYSSSKHIIRWTVLLICAWLLFYILRALWVRHIIWWIVLLIFAWHIF